MAFSTFFLPPPACRHSFISRQAWSTMNPSPPAFYDVLFLTFRASLSSPDSLPSRATYGAFPLNFRGFSLLFFPLVGDLRRFPTDPRPTGPSSSNPIDRVSLFRSPPIFRFDSISSCHKTPCLPSSICPSPPFFDISFSFNPLVAV